MDFCFRLRRAEKVNSIVFLVLLFGGALLQAGCSERAQIKSLRGSAGRGDTVVRAATTDSRGNVIVVGSSYSPGLAMEGAYQGRFKSTGNLGYYDPRRKTYFPFATTPLAQPSTLTLIGGSSDRAYLSSQFGFFRAADIVLSCRACAGKKRRDATVAMTLPTVITVHGAQHES